MVRLFSAMFFYTFCLFFTIAFATKVAKADLSNEFQQMEEELSYYSSDYSYNYNYNYDYGDTLLRKKLQSYVVFYIDGFFAKSFIQIVNDVRAMGVPIPSSLFLTFGDQENYFRTNKIAFYRVPIGSFASMEDNSKTILKAINNQKIVGNKKVIIITHSKGGLDLLQALLDHPELKQKIAGWIALQTPFQGSPLVSLFDSNRALNSIWRSFLALLRANYQSFSCMTSEFMSNYFSQNSTSIQDALTDLPKITVGTYVEADYFRSIIEFMKGDLSILNPLTIYLNNHLEGGKNDGFVPVKGMCLDSKDCLTLPDMDHAAAIMDVPLFKSLGKEQRLHLTKVLLLMLLQRIV
ncbi:MAG: hypothetical protein HQK50_12850 [Oligoflexia bacterium]|nr:hypothetical protein [Oligoflexia bacterium]MBF0366453.1 hypothetical protein [Oligoflexia bacterium]